MGASETLRSYRDINGNFYLVVPGEAPERQDFNLNTPDDSLSAAKVPTRTPEGA